jgi:protein-arginine kinase activator protein McsA
MRPRAEREPVERWDQSDDAEAALEELIRVMVRREPAAAAESVRVRRDEFVCRSCHMVQHQSRLADVRKFLCSECVNGRSRERRSRI